MIYFDQASTSFPKAPGLGQTMAAFLEKGAVNVNRGTYGLAYELAADIFACRTDLAAFFNAQDARNVIFTTNVTQSLNMALQGFLRPGDHVLITPLEHNAVLRPLHNLSAENITYDFLPTDEMGYVDCGRLEEFVQPGRTKAIICNHGSNLSGVVQDLTSIGHFCQKNKLAFIVDAAQTAGLFPLNIKKMHISCLCFTGHKALLGPQGIGGLVLTDDFAAEMKTLIQGGTGSFSSSLTMPELLPDKFEAGTLNLPGIIGLQHALKHLLSLSLENRLSEEMQLTAAFLEGLKAISGNRLRLIGPQHCRQRTAVVSVSNLEEDLDLAFLAYHLDARYKIQTRVGLHCTPAAHQFYGSAKTGALRFSFSHLNTPAEVETCLNALEDLLNKA